MHLCASAFRYLRLLEREKSGSTSSGAPKFPDPGRLQKTWDWTSSSIGTQLAPLLGFFRWLVGLAICSIFSPFFSQQLVRLERCNPPWEDDNLREVVGRSGLLELQSLKVDD